MRRGPTTVMTLATAAVLAASLRAGSPASNASHAAPVGIVLATAPAATSSPATSRPTPSPAHHLPVRTAAVAPTTAAVSRPPRAAAVSPRPRPRPSATPAATVKTVAPETAVNGQSTDTQYGPVQVQITVQSRRIVRAVAIAYPQDSDRDQQINSYAVPQLQQETLQAQSAHIDSVSGATYTSNGYIASLQSALDAAHSAGVL